MSTDNGAPQEVSGSPKGAQKHTGGSAFPEVFTDIVAKGCAFHSEVYSAGGMTLRDYFAAKAMQGFCVQGGRYDCIAENAFKMADCMLAARREA